MQRFEHNLAENWSALERVLKDGGPLPLRRKFIPQEPGKFRPLGIPAVRDRMAQKVVCRLWHPIFEPWFHDASFGFRPGRNGHQALSRVLELHEEGFPVVLDADLKRFFDKLSPAVIRAAVAAQVADGNLLRLVEKFLRSGVRADGGFKPTTMGTPQGGVMRSSRSRRMRPKSLRKFKDKVRELTVRSANLDAPAFEKLNRVIRGTAPSFATRWFTGREIFHQLDSWIRLRLRCLKTKRLNYEDNRRLRVKWLERHGLLSLESFCWR